MSALMLNISVILIGVICFVLGLLCGYRWHKSEITPKGIIEKPRFQVIYIDPKIVKRMYGIPEPKASR